MKFANFSLAGICVSLTLPIALPFILLGQDDHPRQLPSPAASILREYDEALDQVAERAMQSVVEIEVLGYGLPENNRETEAFQRQRTLGSGVIVDPGGYIITNNHVISGALRIRVILSPATVSIVPYHTTLARQQHVYDATLIGANRYADLALIKIDAKSLPFIPLPEAYQVRLGQTVLAIGSPEGLDHTVTKGIVSALGRQPEIDRPMVYVQTDAPINPGNSGGPLIDRSGNLIGINTFIATKGGGSEGLGFAIPEPVVRFVYAELREHGIVRAVTIGAHAQTITPSLAGGLRLRQDWGVIFSDIDPGSPAAAGGLRPGDVVASIDGVRIDSLPKYTAFLYIHRRDRPLEMQVIRNGETVTANVSPIEAPESMESLSDLVNPKTDLVAPLDIFGIDLKDRAADAMPTRSKSGVLVAGMLSEEPETYADLQLGDVILSMNGKPVNTTEELRSSLSGMKPGDPVVFEVERRGILQYVAFDMGD